MRKVIGSDHAGLALKRELLETILRDREVKDFGTFSLNSVDYPDIAKEVCKHISIGGFERGILICGTGIGMSMAANKIKGIRAAKCDDVYSARMSVEHNNANVLCLGGRVLGIEIAKEIVKVWLEATFEGGRHLRRVKKIMALEE